MPAYSGMFAVLACLAMSSQEPTRQLGGPTTAQIVETVGDDATAGGLIARTIRATLDIDHQSRVIVVREAQVPVRWLPAIEGVSYVVMDDRQIAVHVEACGRYLFVEGVNRVDEEITVSVGQAGRCWLDGITMSYWRGPRGWDRSAMSGSFGGAFGHCTCQ